MEDRGTRTYLVHIRLGDINANLMTRIRQTMPGLKDDLERLSQRRLTLAWTSEDSGSVTFFVQSELDARRLLAALESPDRANFTSQTYKGSSLQKEDQVAIVELGKDFAMRNFGAATAWLQRRMIS